MKNVFKLLGVVCIACTFLAAACGGGDDAVTYKIKVKANPSKGGVVKGEGIYEQGAQVILTATPNAGYVFVNWEDDANAAATRTITVTGDATYTANFEEEAAQSGIKVTFGSSTWDAGYINALYSASQGIFLIHSTQGAASNSYPQALINYQSESGAITTGTVTGSPEVDLDQMSVNFGNPYMWYYSEAEREVPFQDGSKGGDWWNKNLTLNITAFDATTPMISFVAQSVMGDLSACLYEGGPTWETTETQNMSMTGTNVALTNAKGSIKINTSSKLARK